MNAYSSEKKNLGTLPGILYFFTYLRAKRAKKKKVSDLF